MLLSLKIGRSSSLLGLLLCLLFSSANTAHISKSNSQHGVESHSNCVTDSLIISSLSFLYPRDQEMLSAPSVQPQLSSTALDYDEAVARNHELSLTYSFYVRQENGDWERYEQASDLQVFGTHVFRAQFGENKLVASIRHRPAGDRLICEAAVVFKCCDHNESDLRLDQNGRIIVGGNEEKRVLQGVQRSLQDYVAAVRDIQHDLAQKHTSESILQPKERLRRAIQTLRRDEKRMLVLIPIKSFALNAHIRQAIRQTYFALLQRPSGPLLGWTVEFLPFFVVGKSLFLTMSGDVDREHIDELQRALHVERALFGDVLLETEIDAVDTYFTLAEKVLQFFHWVDEAVQEVVSEELHRDHRHTGGSNSVEKATWQRVASIVADDDTYLNIPEITHFLIQHIHNLSQTYSEPFAQHWYGGEVLATRLQHTYRPIRHPDNLHYLHREYFPFEELPPFALGNCYFLSGLLGRYIAMNYDVLKPVGTLEDLSVGFWALSLRVQAQHFNGVCELQRCVADVKLFRSDAIAGVDNIRHRMFAVAKLTANTSFHLLHAAVVGHVYGSGDRSRVSLLHGAQRTFSAEEESGEVLQVYYGSIFRALQDIDALQTAQFGAVKKPSKENRLMFQEYSEDRKKQLQEDQAKREKFNAFVNTVFQTDSLQALLLSAGQQSPLLAKQSRVLVVMDDLLADEPEAILSYLAASVLAHKNDLEVELLLSSLKLTAFGTFSKIANLQLPIRYFDFLQHHKWDDFTSKQLATPSMVLLMRYLHSFDHVVHVLPFGKGIHAANGTAIHAFLAYLPKVVPSLATHLRRNLSVESVPSFTLSVLLQSLRTRKTDVSPHKRLGKLSQPYLQRGYTLGVVYSVFIFTAGSLYAKPFLEDMVKQHLPSHFQPHLFLLLTRDVSTNRPVLTRHDGALLTEEDWRTVSAASSYLFATSFLDCSTEKKSASGPRLVFTTQASNASTTTSTSIQCLQAHFDHLLDLLLHHLQGDGLTANDVAYRLRSVFLSGEVLVDVQPHSLTGVLEEVDNTMDVLDSLAMHVPWLNFVFLCSMFRPLELLGAFAQNLESSWKGGRFKVFHIPVFANLFYELKSVESQPLRPLDLLLPRPVQPVSESRQRDDSKLLRIAYLYYRCDRVEREALFTLLSALQNVTVDALGRCPLRVTDTGDSNQHQKSRFQASYNADAISKYRNYDLVIAGENAFDGYYITEKLINVFLAGAVPLYIGTSTVLQHFSAAAMLYCDPRDLQPCLREVAAIAKDGNRGKLEGYRKHAIFAGNTVEEQAQHWLEMFYWHEDAQDTAVYQQFQRLFRHAFHRITV